MTTPIKQTSHSRPHRPVYRMHRYFARRPYSLFADLIEHYSEPGMVVLDPFCGGGVTLVEGITKQRRVIGFDSNPLAAFITKMELQEFDEKEFRRARDLILSKFEAVCGNLFSTSCRKCKKPSKANWFQYSAKASCASCRKSFLISDAEKTGAGVWACPHCNDAVRFSPRGDTQFEVISVSYGCTKCGSSGLAPANNADRQRTNALAEELRNKELEGFWLPASEIPDCNMQRESALLKKGIKQFRQFFTDRHLLALGQLREMILSADPGVRDWLWLAFSSTLRYTNRMVTLNLAWRGERPLEWAKPGYWLPAIHLEADPLEELRRRCEAILKGKRDFLSQMKVVSRSAATTSVLLKSETPVYFVQCQSSTRIPLPDNSVDVVITDPPYGSYVHYADLSNFWAVWLPESLGLGAVIDDSEEAVVARKKFPKAKSLADYQRLLEECFAECARVLKDESFMVMTFHNREPRAWAALLLAAAKAGFELPADGVVFQDGISSYKHTAQSRRAGSVIGDFVLSFKKIGKKKKATRRTTNQTTHDLFVDTIRGILTKEGALTPNDLIRKLYLTIQPRLMERVVVAVGGGANSAEELVREFDSIDMLDSHRKSLLERQFRYFDGKWALKP